VSTIIERKCIAIYWILEGGKYPIHVSKKDKADRLSKISFINLKKAPINGFNYFYTQFHGKENIGYFVLSPSKNSKSRDF